MGIVGLITEMGRIRGARGEGESGTNGEICLGHVTCGGCCPGLKSISPNVMSTWNLRM